MHRFIFIATFLPAVFLMDLLASSASLPQEPPDLTLVQRAAELSSVTAHAVIEASKNAVEAGKRTPLKCKDPLLDLALDALRRNEHETDKRGRNLVDSLIDKGHVTGCTELFDTPQPVDLNGDGKKEFIVRTAYHPEIGFYRGRSVNHQTWVIGIDHRGFRILLDAHIVAGVEIQKKTTSYADLVTTNPSAGVADTITYYRYRNEAYRISRCVDETRIGNGKIRRTELDPIDCG